MKPLSTMNLNRLIVPLLVLSLSFSPAPCAAGNLFDDLSSLDKDAYVHFSAGVLVSHAAYPLLRKYYPRNQALWYSVLLTALLGTAKELADRNTTGFSGSDLAAGILGGCTLFVVSFD